MANQPRLPFDPIAEARRHWIERGWAETADGMAALTSIVRVQQILLGRIEAALRPLDLTFARFELLTLLSFTQRGLLPLGKIGVRLQVHPASITNAVNRLEAEGLVQRVPHEEDGRVTLARITPKGRKLAARATEVLNQTVFGDLGLDERQTQQLFELLSVVRRGAGDF